MIALSPVPAGGRALSLIAAALTLTAILLGPAPGSAEEVRADTGQGERAEARAHSERAQIQYNLGRFDQALEEFSRAYELFPHAAFLFNIGQCHRELARHDQAIFFFERYLHDMPDAVNRDLVLDLIAESQRALEQRQTVAPQGGTAHGEDAADGPPRPSGTDSDQAEAPEGIGPDDRDGSQRPRSVPVYRRWWFWTVIGTLVVGTIAGGTAAGVLASEPRTVPPAGTLGTLDWR